jgi:hypothetical protein
MTPQIKLQEVWIGYPSHRENAQQRTKYLLLQRAVFHVCSSSYKNTMAESFIMNKKRSKTHDNMDLCHCFVCRTRLSAAVPCISEVSYILFIIQRFTQFWNRRVKRMKAACIHRKCSMCLQILFIHKCKRSIQLAIIGSRVSEVMSHASVIGHRQRGLFAGHKKRLDTLA